MMFSAILISGREWVFPVAGFSCVAILVLLWTYLRAPANKGVRTVCASLKLLGVAALLVCLLEPHWTTQRARPGANYFAVVADNSQGMRIKDRGGSYTRGEALTNLIATGAGTWLADLEEDFRVRRYVFDSRLQSSRRFAELDFNGRASSMAGALHDLGERFRGQPLAGVLLFTDGNATDVPEGRFDTSGLPPVYPVVMGSDETIADVAIEAVSVSQTAFEDAPVTVQAEVRAGGYDGRMIRARLVDQAGVVVEELNQRATDGRCAFRFQVQPERSGVSFYRLRVSARDETEQFDRPEASVEATLANNTRVITVDRGRGPYRILYVSGRPNWEFKFLNRALADDAQVDLVGLIRIARREKPFAHMEFRSRPGESSNPLFRGFDRTTEVTEGYDEPVLVRLNTKDETELVGGFPKKSDVLYDYTAVIVDDLEAEFFTRDQMTLLQKFVSVRGGGFLMLGGAESFREGGYERTPVAEMLPVYLESAPEARAVENLRLNLTREGWLQPWARLRDNEAAERQRLTTMPGLNVINPVRGVKPGASVIAEAQDERGGKQPALVAQRFGNGRVGAVLAGDMWRGGFRDEGTRKDSDKAWRQMIRWLIADVPARIELTAVPVRDDPNQSLSLQVRARDKEFRPLENAKVEIRVTPGADGIDNAHGGAGSEGTNSVRLTAEPALNEAGLYEARYVPRQTGGFLAEAVVTDAGGVEAGRVEAGWAADPAAEEFKSLKPNRALLESLARQTGGEIIPADALKAFAAELPRRNAPVTESWSFPLWHQPWVFLVALACFIAEWGLRRWKGLA